MELHTLITVGLLGLASGGFTGGAPISIGAGVAAQTYGDIKSLVVQLRPAEPQAPAGPKIFIPIHKPSDFPFTIIVPDDGIGPAGGWQAAKANLPFKKVNFLSVITWYCPITIQVPIRHSKLGYISPANAATMSAAVTNNVAATMASGTDFDLPQGIFCSKFRPGVLAAFSIMYPGVGVRVTL